VQALCTSALHCEVVPCDSTAFWFVRYRLMATGNIHRNFLRFGHAAFEMCQWTDRHTDTLTAVGYFASSRERVNNVEK